MIQARNIDLTTLGGNYSLSEVDTGYTWINGKHIYKKTVAVASSQITANSDNEIPHGISNFDRAITVTGHLFLDNGATRIVTGGSRDHRFSIGNIESTKFTYFSTLATAGTYYFTLWYIKS